MERIEALGILGLNEQATDEEIHQAYQVKDAAIQAAFLDQAQQPDVVADKLLHDKLALTFYKLQQKLQTVYGTLNVSLDVAASEDLAENILADVDASVIAQDAPVDAEIDLLADFDAAFDELDAVESSQNIEDGSIVGDEFDLALDGLLDEPEPEVESEQEPESKPEPETKPDSAKSEVTDAVGDVPAVESPAEPEAIEEKPSPSKKKTLQIVAVIALLLLVVGLSFLFFSTKQDESIEAAAAVKAKAQQQTHMQKQVNELINAITALKSELALVLSANEKVEVQGDEHQRVQLFFSRKIKNSSAYANMEKVSLSVELANDAYLKKLQKLKKEYGVYVSCSKFLAQASATAEVRKKLPCDSLALLPKGLSHYFDNEAQTYPILASLEQINQLKLRWQFLRDEYQLEASVQISAADLFERQGTALYQQHKLLEAMPQFEAAVANYTQAISLLEASVVKEPVKVDALNAFVGTLVKVPAGLFIMGNASAHTSSDALPLHTVNIAQFTIAEHELTFAQWQLCHQAGACINPSDNGWGKEARPIIHISWDDVQVYLQWLNNETGRAFRLPSEAEWEYAARAGSKTQYAWGDDIECSQARFSYKSEKCVNTNATDAVKSYMANTWGLFDVHGNVWEMTADCWNDSYAGAPKEGIAWKKGDCKRKVMRGGSWKDPGEDITVANRNWLANDFRSHNIGLRLAHDGWLGENKPATNAQ